MEGPKEKYCWSSRDNFDARNCFLNESTDKKRAETLKTSSAEVSIAIVMTMTTVLTTKLVTGLMASAPVIGMEVASSSMKSQQSTSSVVMLVVAETTPLMAGQIFRDFLISTRRKKINIHESIKKLQVI
jgi:hypothetical protein